MEAAGKSGAAAWESKAKKERSTSINPEECPVCMTVFDDNVQRPSILPCGHTVCTMCVIQLKQQGHVSCPECRVSHAVPEGGMFPVSYTIEAFIRRLRSGEAAPAASPSPSAGTGKEAAGAAGQKETADLSNVMSSFLQEQEASIVAVVTACQDFQAQLNQYQTTLTGWGKQQQQLENRLQDLLDHSRNARELVRKEESRVAAKKEEARERKRQLHAALGALRTTATDKEAGVAAAEVLRCTLETKEMLEECQGSFPDPHTARFVRKVRVPALYPFFGTSQQEVKFLPKPIMLFQVREASDAALEIFNAAQEVHEVHPYVYRKGPGSDANYTIEDRLQAILMPTLWVEDLRSPTQPVMKMLETGRVFGVHEDEGRFRHARISLEAGRLYLHSLKERGLPAGATVLQIDRVLMPFPPCVVFLDLNWPGSVPRRVHISLRPDTPLGRQWVLLCTGQRGASYANTLLFKTVNKGQPGERVLGGDYLRNDGEGGAALLANLDKGEYRVSGKAGAVYGWPSDPARGAQFAIITKQDYSEHKGVFGDVVEGLDIVVEAAQHTLIKEVMIWDCGGVL